MTLLNQIITDVWMIDTKYVHSVAPKIISLLQGNKVDFGQSSKNEGSYYLKPDGSQSLSIESTDNNLIAVIDIIGAITKYNQFCGPKGTLGIDKEIKQLSLNDKVKAIVLNLDTPGGQASYLSTLSNTISETTKKKPVLAYYSGLCASAGYYIASNCTEIYASEPTDIVGSIGTVSSFFDYTKYFENAGVKLHEVYADQSTDKNQVFNKALNGDYKDLKNQILNPFAQSFIDVVKSNRNISDESIFKGGTYMSKKAIELNLIDGIKTFDEVIARANELINKSQINQNINSMNKNVLLVASILGFETFESADGKNISLSLESVEEIGNHIESLNSKLAASEKIEDNEDFIELSNKVSGLETENSTLTSKNESLNQEITSLKSQLPGAAKTETENKGDNNLDAGSSKKEPWLDPEDEFNKGVDEYLGDGPDELGV